jgi:hypothetical protein
MAPLVCLRHEGGNTEEMLLESKTAVIYGAGGAIGGDTTKRNGNVFSTKT